MHDFPVFGSLSALPGLPADRRVQPGMPFPKAPAFGASPQADQFVRRHSEQPCKHPRRRYLQRLSFAGNPDPAQRYRVVAIVDDFKDKKYRLMSVNRAGEKQTAVSASHGELVEAYARLVDPRVRSARYQVNKRADGQYDILPALQQLFSDIRDGQTIDAANVSFGIPAPFQRLREDLSLPGLRADNVKSFRQAILKRLERLKVDRIDNESARKQLGNAWSQSVKSLRTQLYVLQEIGKRVPVYLSAGNEGPGYLNLLSLARHTISVGALRPNGQKARYSADNELVSQWEPAGYPLAVQTDGKRLTGFRLDLPQTNHAKRRPVLKAKHLHFSDRNLRRHWDSLGGDSCELEAPYGTSYAAPQAAVKAAISGKRINFA